MKRLKLAAGLALAGGVLVLPRLWTSSRHQPRSRNRWRKSNTRKPVASPTWLPVRFGTVAEEFMLGRTFASITKSVDTKRSESDNVRLDRLRLAVCFALAAGLVLSPKLWVSSRSYPLTPVSTLLPEIPFPFDYAVFVALLLLIARVAVAQKHGRPFAALLIIAAALGLLDQSRWQPWFYQYLFMLGAIALHHWARKPGDAPMAALNTCRLIVASVYLWSGLHKLNRSFVNETFPWFLQGVHVPAGLLGYASRLGPLAPLLETAIGIGLLTMRWRQASIIGAFLMHAFVLASLGPLGHDVNRLVWPWNLAMIAFVVILFRHTPLLQFRDVVSSNNGWYHAVVLLLFAILPVLSFFHLWDSYLSFAAYSGDTKNARIYISDGVRDTLPSDVLTHVRKDEAGRNLLDIISWCNEIKVPVYPETRMFRRLAMYACRYAKAPTDVELVIERRSLAAVLKSLMRLRLEPTFRSSSRYDCGSLR